MLVQRYSQFFAATKSINRFIFAMGGISAQPELVNIVKGFENEAFFPASVLFMREESRIIEVLISHKV